MMWSASLPARALVAGVTLLTLAAAACTPPERGAAGSPPPVYVLNAGDGTVSALDGWASHARHGTLDTQARPTAMASGPAGTLLFLAAGSAASATAAAGAADGERSSVGAAGLRVVQMTPGANHEAPRQIAVDATGRDGRLASIGGRYAVVLYRLTGIAVGSGAVGGLGGLDAPGCRLAVIDLAAGAVTSRWPLCGDHEVAGGVALGNPGDGAGRTLVYASVWSYATASGSERATRRARLVALDAATGAVVASLPVDSAPTQLVVATAPDGAGAHLYVVEGDPDGDEASAGDRWRLVERDAVTLQVERVTRLDDEVRGLSATPDGRALYGLSAAGRTLLCFDLTTGDQRALALPDWGQDVLATAAYVYIANVYGNTVWIVDRRSGRLRSVGVGPRPIALAFHAG